MAVALRISQECRDRCQAHGYQCLSDYVGPETAMTVNCLFHGPGKRKLKQIRKSKFCAKCWKYRKEHFQSDCEFRVYRFFRLLGVPILHQPELPGTRCHFDFLIPDFPPIYIEIDGAQHYQYTRKWHKKKLEFENQKLRDRKKVDWCRENGYRLFRWCDDRVTTIPEIWSIWRESLQHHSYLSNPERYPHLK